MGSMDNKEEQEVIDLKSIFELICKRAVIIVFVAVVFAVAAFVYTKLCIPKTYSSNISLYVKNTNSTVESLNANDLTASQTLANTYISILGEDVVMDNIGQKLMSKYSMEQLEPYFVFDLDDAGNTIIATSSIRSKISFSMVNDTELIRVTSRCGNPIIATDMCSFVADAAPDILVRVIGAGAVEAVSEAKVPRVPVGPNTKKNCAFAFILGAAIVIAISVLQSILDKKITDVETLRSKVDIPMLAEIPFYSIVDEKGMNNNHTKKRISYFAKLMGKEEPEVSVVGTIINTDVPFNVTEAYNTFRTNMLFALSTSKKNVIVVSSSFSGEGKSTSAANMCISLGETSAKVLLIDADLRRPTQHRLFNIKNDVGLSNLLSGMSKIDETIHKNVHGNLDIITAGNIPPNPSQMLASEKTEEIVNKLSEMYDYVIIDTPPVNVVSDALSLLRCAAGCILIARQNISQYDELEEAVSRIEFANGNILGLVINSVESDKKTYGYKYKYKYKYSYDNSKNDNSKKSVKKA